MMNSLQPAMMEPGMEQHVNMFEQQVMGMPPMVLPFYYLPNTTSTAISSTTASSNAICYYSYY